MYIADLHIHSRFSYATSQDCDLPHLDWWARRKGIGLLGTGDFTHPAWRAELRQQLVPAEEGVYILKEEYRLPGAAGTIGLIRPLSRCFCRQCNRIRLTADGCLKPCLHSREELPLRGLHGEQLRAQLERAILHKPEQHAELSARSRSQAARDMNQIGG